MLILLRENWHMSLANLYLHVQEQKIGKMDMILTKAETLDGLTLFSDIQYVIHSAIFKFAYTRGRKHLDKAKDLLEKLKN